MAVPGHAHIRNKLLSLLPTEDFNQISSSLEEVSLPKGMKLAEAGERIEYIYFLTEGQPGRGRHLRP
jgi:CRP-like cAMP-binding protein